MSKDILEDLPFDQPKPKEKKGKARRQKPQRDSGAPVEEIDNLPTEIEEDAAASGESPVVAEVPESEPVENLSEFDALPPEPSQSPWEKFLAALPREVLSLVYSCGLLTLETLLTQTEASLSLPAGKFTPFQLTQLTTVMARFGWQLSLPLPPVPHYERSEDTRVLDVIDGGDAAKAQRARNERLLRARRLA